jgi:selenocysteine-specific elongation factor
MVVVDEPSLLPASILDVQITMLPDVPRIAASSRVRLLIGTAEVLAVADPIGEDVLIENSTRFVQLRTENPIVALPGDRFIIRRESPLETLGGGVVLDPWASRAKRKHHDEIANDLQALVDGDPSRLLKRAGPAGLSLDQARVRGRLTGTTLGDRLIHSDHVDSLTQRLLDGLASWHRDRPLDPGAPRRALHSGALAALNERAFDALIGHMAQQGTVCTEGPTIRLATFTIKLDDAQKEAHDALISRLQAVGLEGEPFTEIIKGPTGLLQLILDQGRAVRIADRVVLSKALEQLKTDVRHYFSENERLSPAEFKSMTQLSRRMAIPLMEWLDSEGITRRDGDARVAR